MVMKSTNQSQLYFNQSSKKITIKNMEYSETECRKLLANMIIEDELSFQFVEHNGFQKLVAGLRSEFELHSADTVKKDIMQTYESHKNSVKKILQDVSGRISLTTDVWTSQQQLGYIAITAHYIDINWNLVSFLMSFKLLPYPHTGVNIANSIKLATDFYSISTKVDIVINVIIEFYESYEFCILLLSSQ
jgi:hypothetical protein